MRVDIVPAAGATTGSIGGPEILARLPGDRRSEFEALGLVKRAAGGNDMTVVATLEMIARTSEQDRREHPVEYLPAPPAVA